MYIIIYYHILSYIIIYYHILLSYYHILLSYYHILSYTCITTFETMKAGHFIHFVTTEGPTMVVTEGEIFEFWTTQDV